MVSAAGRIASSVANTTWESGIASRILAPLEMNSTITSTLAAYATGNYALPHGLNPQTNKVEPYPPTVNTIIEPIGPAGSIVSSIADMTKWTRFLVSGGNTKNGKSLLSAKSLEFTFAPHMTLSGPRYDSFQFDSPFFPAAFHTQTYGVGWLRGDYRGTTMLWHNGGTIGHTTFVVLLPIYKLSVTILSNSDTLGISGLPIIFTALDLALDEKLWINVTNARTWPCPWSPKCYDQSKAIPPSRDDLTLQKWKTFVEPPRARTCYRFDDACFTITEYSGIYTHPAFGSVKITTSARGIISEYGNQKCITKDKEGDGFLLCCTAEYYLGTMLRIVQFTRGIDGKIDAVRIPDYDPGIPFVTFVRGNAPKHLNSFASTA